MPRRDLTRGCLRRRAWRRVKALVNPARRLGICFLGFGQLTMFPAIERFRFEPIFLLIASSLTSSVALYVALSAFLAKRR